MEEYSKSLLVNLVGGERGRHKMLSKTNNRVWTAGESERAESIATIWRGVMQLTIDQVGGQGTFGWQGAFLHDGHHLLWIRKTPERRKR